MFSLPECQLPARKKFNSCFTRSPAKKVRCKMKMRLWLRNSNISLDARTVRRWLRKSLIAALALACSASLAQALDPNRVMAQYMREHWGSEKGFTGGSVTALAQTPDGYLWIGTEKGLIRFDGFSFLNFPQAIPTSLPMSKATFGSFCRAPKSCVTTRENSSSAVKSRSSESLRFSNAGMARCFLHLLLLARSPTIREDLNGSARLPNPQIRLPAQPRSPRTSFPAVSVGQPALRLIASPNPIRP